MSAGSKCHVNVYPHPDFKRLSQAGRYGDGLIEMDHHCGMVLNAIREAGIAENTLVIWTSDNGPMIASYEGTQTGITLFRGQKGGTWEGGMRQPLIAWWPGTIAPGTSTGELMTIMDLYTTSAHLAGAGHKIEELRKDRVVDGNNQVPLLKGTGPSATKTVFYYNHNRLMAIRGCKAGSKWELHLRYQEPWRTGGPGLAEWYGGIQEPAVPLLFDIKQVSLRNVAAVRSESLGRRLRHGGGVRPHHGDGALPQHQAGVPSEILAWWHRTNYMSVIPCLTRKSTAVAAGFPP